MRRQGVRAAIVTLETALNNQLDSSTTPKMYKGTTKMALVINTRQISSRDMSTTSKTTMQ